MTSSFIYPPPPPPPPPTVSQDTTPRRRMLKKEFQNKDPKYPVVLKTQSDHKPKTQRYKTGGRSGSDDYRVEESLTPNQSSHSKSPSIGSSLRKGFLSILSPKSTHSAGSVRKNFRSILSPKSTHSAGRQVRKQYDRDDDESFNDRQRDGGYDEFADDDDDDDDDNYVDQDKFLVILCKELKITLDDDE
jgi:hypothetical protein